MNLLLFGGNSLHNRDWLAEVAREVAPLFGSTHMHQYAHWEAGEGSIDLDSELRVASAQATQLDEYGVFAKSAGALLTLKGIAEGTLTPKWCVLVGLPLNFARQNDFAAATWLTATTVPVIVLQNTDDPTAGFAEVRDFLAAHAGTNVSVRELPGDSHEYRDFAAIKTAITSFL